MNCAVCQKPICYGARVGALPKHARYCPPCRAARRRWRTKWISTPRLDQEIRRCYLIRLRSRKVPGLGALSQRIGWPKWALIRRARALGLSYVKESPWSDAELRILERWAWMSDERIRLKLKATGFSRSATAIHLKVKRMRFKSGSWYTATSLASAFGVDPHQVTRWIATGLLRAQERGTARTPQQGGDMWLITEKDVIRFIRDSPAAYDLRKVSQSWFLDLALPQCGRAL